MTNLEEAHIPLLGRDCRTYGEVLRSCHSSPKEPFTWLLIFLLTCSAHILFVLIKSFFFLNIVEVQKVTNLK